MSSSWVPNLGQSSDFGLANLPFGIISTEEDSSHRAAVAIGDNALDLRALTSHASRLAVPELKEQVYADVFSKSTLNAFAALGRTVHRRVRAALQDLLSGDGSQLPEHVQKEVLIPINKVAMHLPMEIGDYTDFYAGYNHAFAVGCMFRGPEHALQPNYLHLPVGYHGRASSIVPSGTEIRRPWGQTRLPNAPDAPVTGPSRRLDLELELGCFVSRPNDMNVPVKVEDAEEHIFGYVLLNDWSARDIQAWEYVPLGPFNSKNFATTISPWVVLADALEPFRAKPLSNTTERQPYLAEKRVDSVFDIRLEVDLRTADGTTTTISRVSSMELVWSFPQMIAHHTLGGCPLRTGDLLGSGTISGTQPGEAGSMLEMSENGNKDILLAGMDARRFLKDGDTIVLRGVCGEGDQRVGFGSCEGRIISAFSGPF